MPVYICNSVKGTIKDAAKPKIAADITRIHCEVTGAPPQFVHAFFLEEAPQVPLDGKVAVVRGSIRSGRADTLKTRIVAEMGQSVQQHAGLGGHDGHGRGEGRQAHQHRRQLHRRRFLRCSSPPLLRWLRWSPASLLCCL